MDTFEFKKLDIDDQVNEVNKLLANGDSLVTVARKLNDSESAIRKRFNRKGYTRPNKELFQLTIEVVTSDAPILSTTNKYSDETIKGLINRISTIESTLKELQSSPERITAAKDNFELPSINNFSCSAKGRTLKIYDSSIDKLSLLLKQYPSLLKQDVISTAIENYVDKYLK